MKLVPPHGRYAASYVAALREGFRRGLQPVTPKARVRAIEADFPAHLAEITAQGGTVTLPTGETVPKVPESKLWLVEGDAFVGEVGIRHRLTEHLLVFGGHIGYGIRPSRQRQGCGKRILALALDECRRLGIARVLVTCLADNVASARIIEANGGVRENTVPSPDGRGPLHRYWIALG